MIEVLDEKAEEVPEEVNADVADVTDAEEVVKSVVQKIADLESQEEE